MPNSGHAPVVARTWRTAAGAFAVIIVLIWGSCAQAVVVGQIDDFEDGTTQGWRHGSTTTPLPPTNIGTGGPAGADDNWLRIQTDGNETGSASRMLALNTAHWTGDYLSAGVGSIRLHARNPNDVELVLRLGFRGGASSTFVTNGISLPAGTTWTELTFDLDAANMALAQGSYEDCFGGVTMARIIHQPFAPVGDNGEPVRDATGAPIAAQLGIDNIAAVPEPGPLAPLGIGMTFGLFRRRARRRA